MNPFGYKDKFSSIDMKEKYKELNNLIAEMCLLHAEEQGIEVDYNALLASFDGSIGLTLAHFKSLAYHKLNNQPETSLDVNEKIAIAAHEAYKVVVRG